ncbi:MAG TPA: RNA ligase [Verrucomicrobiae bacterium]|nr:RNA ligase [Verrucomicrobiae bacterium]
MRQLYITRGIPGSGKSTFIQENNLEAYTVSPDTIRLVLGSPVLDTKGRLVMPSKDDATVWKLLRESIETRMARGELIIIDATHTLPRYFHDYAKLARTYRYKLFAIDFADVPLEICKQRNKTRASYKVVDDKVLETMHARLQNFTIPKGYTVIKPDEVKATLEYTPTDLSQYTRIHHIGDIQGCYTPLRQYFDEHPFRDDEYYIFTGDLLDRGSENAEVLTYICEQFVDKPNVAFIEGNHDLYIWKWLTHQPITSREFNGRTRGQLESAAIDKPAVSRLLRSMRECFLYTYHEKQVLVSHAGVSALPENLKLLSSEQYIRGAGSYGEVGLVDDAFVANTNNSTYQVHGHRNQQNYPTQYNERTFNLEGKVEFGGDLRVVQLSSAGFKVVEISNQSSELTLHPENAPLVHQLRTNRYITEKTLPGNISSFHFKPEVFYEKKWTKQTITARGLFVNTLTNEIVIRAYDKFFNINERRDTELPALKEKLAFPVKAWVKENGYLGLVGYDAVSGDLIFASKSTTESEFAGWFKQLFMKRFGKHEAAIKQYLARQNACLVFEVMLPNLDPHIIDYTEDHLVLLDIVKRQANFEALPDVERENFAASINAASKRLAAEFANWDEFQTWHDHLKGLEFQLEGSHVEGFVIEDAHHFLVKVKLDFYSFWKQLRTALEAIKNGKQPKVKPESEYPEAAEEVITFMQSLPPEEIAKDTIIDIRRKFLLAQEDKGSESP